MKKHFFKAFLALLMIITCISLSGIRASAAETITLSVYDTSNKLVVSMKANKGDTLADVFKAHPEYYKTICKNDTNNNVPVFFYASGAIANSRPDPDAPFSADRKLTVRLYKPIREIRITMQWPLHDAYTTYGRFDPRASNSSANYSFGNTKWWMGFDQIVRFKAGEEYEVRSAFYPDSGYQPEMFTGNLKVYLNGYLLDASQYELRYSDNYDNDETTLEFTREFIADRSVTQFVQRMYYLCLDRAPDDGGLANWVTGLMLKKKTAADIITGFFNSAEFTKKGLSDEEFVKLCYEVMMDRSADLGGTKYWVERLTNGVSRNFVLKGFVGSAEFSQLCSNYGITPGTIQLSEPRDQNYNLTSFIARMYRLVLGRKFDVGGLNNWCKKVLLAKDRRSAIIDMAFGFFHSKEFMNMNTSDAQYVQILYNVFFDRNPDYAGWDDWVNRLKAGMSRDQVLLGFANSAEFTNVLKKFKLL